MERASAYASVAGSTFVVVSCLVATVIISRDISSMYDDVMTDMGEFRVSAEPMIEIVSLVFVFLGCCR